MPYRLKRKESVADGVARAAREEAEKALTAVTGGGRPADERIHDARTRCKKLRGLLRLVRPHLGDLYREENARLRDAARPLSAVRDAAVVLKAFDELARGGRLERETVDVLRPALAERLGASAGDGCESGRLEVFAGEMRDLLARIESWRIDAHGFDAVRDGLAGTYRRARRTMRHARKTGDDADRHEWRKQAKYHWYHVRLLRNVWKPEMDARRGELDRLSDLLGDDHDLAVLRETAAGLPGLRAGDLGPLLSLVDRRRSALQAAAYPLGERLFAEKPSAFAKRMRRYWKVWRE